MNTKAKIIVWSFIGIAGVFGIYFGAKAISTAIKNKNAAKKMKEEQDKNIADEKAKGNNPPVYAPVTNSSFPLKQGSTGIEVSRLQQALIKLYGANAVGKYGADGIWGADTQAGLTSHGLPTIITNEAMLKAIEAGKNPLTTTSSVNTKVLLIKSGANPAVIRTANNPAASWLTSVANGNYAGIVLQNDYDTATNSTFIRINTPKGYGYVLKSDLGSSSIFDTAAKALAYYQSQL